MIPVRRIERESGYKEKEEIVGNVTIPEKKRLFRNLGCESTRFLERVSRDGWEDRSPLGRWHRKPGR